MLQDARNRHAPRSPAMAASIRLSRSRRAKAPPARCRLQEPGGEKIPQLYARGPADPAPQVLAGGPNACGRANRPPRANANELNNI